MKLPYVALAASGAIGLLLTAPEQAEAGNVRVHVHIGIPAIVSPPHVVYRPAVVYVPHVVYRSPAVRYQPSHHRPPRHHASRASVRGKHGRGNAHWRR